MSITSYAQNFEDVMLWRALGHIERGSYIDIGAQDPVIDSVSLAFHEHGWQGIHVEPTPHYAELLRQQRPGDTVIQAAVGKGPAILRFFEIPNTGISTADAAIAAQHRERGFNVHEITVPCIPLAAVFETCSEQEIHWLKIDVEGFEKQVLSSWGSSAARPWIVVVESTLPLTQIETHESWQATLTAYGYTPVYFDGLNRYYTSVAHPELKTAFASPPNVFDGFTLNGTASATFHKLIEARYQEKISETLAQSEQQKQSLQHEAERLNANLSSLTETHAEHQQNWLQTEQALSEKNRQTTQELEALHRTQAQREHEMAVQLLDVQQQTAQGKADLAHSYGEQERALHRQHAEQEQALNQKLQALQEQLGQLQQERTTREQTLLEQTSQAKQEVENLLRTQAQREQAVAEKLEAIRSQAAQESAKLARSFAEQQHALHSQHTAREQALGQQLEAGKQERIAREQALLEKANQTQQEVENLLRTQVQREQAVAEKLEAVRSQVAQESAELARTLTEQQHALHGQHAAREQALGQQLEAGKQERIKREQALLEQTSQAKQEVENLLRTQVQREREVLAQLLAVQQQATREKAELTRSHAEKERELGNQQAKREKALTQQLHTHQQELRNLQKDRVKREQEVLAQLQASQQQAAQEKAELLQKQSEQEQALHRQHNEHEAALTQQLQELQQLLQRQQEDWAQLGQALNNEIATLQNETQTLHQAQQLQVQQHGLEIRTKLDEHTRLLEACAALEAQLQAEIQSGQQASMHLRQLLAEVQHSLEMTHTSLSWRMTAPLRKLAGLFNSNKYQTPTPVSFSEPITPERGMQVATEPPPITVNQASLEPTMPPLAQATSSNMPTIASTLPELLACHDQYFVCCAYQTLLGRAPDPEGLSYYLGRLRTGFSKMRIVAQLRLSKEGKAHAAQLTGLDTAIQRYQRGQQPLLGGLFRWLDGTEGDRPTERKLRGIENQLFLLSDESNRRFNQLETALTGLHHLVVQQTQSVITALGGTSMTTTDASNIISIQPPEPVGLKQFSPRARDIYFQLKTAAARHAGRAG